MRATNSGQRPSYLVANDQGCDVATSEAIMTAFNANYLQLSGARAQLGHVKDSTYKAQHKAQSVEFDIPASMSNMQLVGATADAANKLWRLVNV